ncbi:MAG: aspartate/glutamate racemase family protein [Roseococcus sp.]
MHVGMIIGIGPAATDFYYRSILGIAGPRGAALDLTMAHADTPTLLRHQSANDVAAQVAIYLRLAQRLQAAGAEAIAVTSIAGHFCIGDFERASPLPVINLVTEVNRAAKAAGHRKLGIIGTRVAMQSRFYGALTDAEVMVPPGALLDAVHEAYIAMATQGAVTAAQRAIFLEAGHALMAAGAEAIMLGGTDLALAFPGGQAPFPLLDCAGIHAAAIARAALD